MRQADEVPKAVSLMSASPREHARSEPPDLGHARVGDERPAVPPPRSSVCRCLKRAIPSATGQDAAAVADLANAAGRGVGGSSTGGLTDARRSRPKPPQRPAEVVPAPAGKRNARIRRCAGLAGAEVARTRLVDAHPPDLGPGLLPRPRAVVWAAGARARLAGATIAASAARFLASVRTGLESAG